METKNFKNNEFECPCCGFGGASVPLLMLLETIRTHFDTPVTVNSSARCKTHNKRVGGAKHSEHLVTEDEPLTDAADIVVHGVSPTKVVAYLKTLPFANLVGIGKYKSWTHVDTRGYAARW